MSTLVETDKYKFNYDSFDGKGYFLRLSDGASTMLERGSDCANLVRDLEKLDLENKPDLIDNLAAEYSYDAVEEQS